MEEKILPEAKYNHNLIQFCNRITRYNILLNDDEIRNIFFVSLISSDTLTDEQSCEETIEIASFIRNNINLFVLNDELKQTTLEYMSKAIDIAKRDKLNYMDKRVDEA